MLRVTAIVPTCERPLLLQRALRSIARQELTPAEIIVVDDAGGGHEDATRATLKRWEFAAVHVVANSRAKGVSGARNTGAAVATGEVLAFLDDDDEWLPTYLADAMRQFETKDCDLLCADLLCQFEDGIDRPGKTAPDRLAPALFLTRNPGFIGSNFMIRRSLYRQTGGFDESLPAAEDTDFGIRLSQHGGVSYQRLPNRLVRHYEHSGPKLTQADGDAIRTGVRRFYELHGHRMTEKDREEFRANVRRFWGIDEQGNSLNLTPKTHAESLLPSLKGWLDRQRRGGPK